MRRNINRALIFSIALFAFYSCTTMGKVNIQVSVPPKYPVSPEIQSIVVLNRSLTPDFTNLDRDSLEKILVKKELALDSVILDSIAADTAVQVAAKALFESERFDVVVPKERNIRRDDSGGLLAPLDMTYIDDICKEFKVDGVLVLENFTEKLTTDFTTRRYNIGFESGRSLREYDGTINLGYKLEWRLYQPLQNPHILRYEVKDTLFWNSYEYSLRAMYDKLPSIKEAVISGGIASGTDMAENISPKWADETRKYYITGNKEIDAAIPLIKMNKWDDAAEIWNKYSTVSSNSTRSQVEFNMALAAEMQGDINKAIEWAVKSFKTKYSREAELYLKYLYYRRSLIEKESKK
jgi:hypothetical protein